MLQNILILCGTLAYADKLIVTQIENLNISAGQENTQKVDGN
jgi:hypothetical protein